MILASEHMPLLERLRKGANCAVFLDGAPEPAADVADMLRKAADEIEQLRAVIARIDSINDRPSVYNPEINDECDKILRPELLKV